MEETQAEPARGDKVPMRSLRLRGKPALRPQNAQEEPPRGRQVLLRCVRVFSLGQQHAEKAQKTKTYDVEDMCLGPKDDGF